MKKTSVSLVLAACALAVPSFATAHGKPDGAGSKAAAGHGKAGQSHGKSHKCKAHSVGYVVGGTLVSDDLTQTAGQDTATDTSDDRYTGTVTLNVTHTNHWARALKGEQTLDVSDVRVSYGDGVTQPPAAGTLVQVIGKVTTVAKKCADKSSAGVVTLKKVAFESPSADTTDGQEG
jgi:hypothetical protein